MNVLPSGGAPVWTDATGAIVVSGELVLDNADELRLKLRLPDADPGVLLAELYLLHGAKAGLHALGMFAVAIWDTREKRLLLMRDGVGARTLYYATNGRAWWFSARLRALPAMSCCVKRYFPDSVAEIPDLRFRPRCRPRFGRTYRNCALVRR